MTVGSVSLASTLIVTATPFWVVAVSLPATGLWLKAAAFGLRFRNVVMVAVGGGGRGRVLHAKAVETSPGPIDCEAGVSINREVAVSMNPFSG